MNPRIVIHALTISGPVREVTYPFRPGVNVVVGSVGTGKTSMLQVLKWTLGGNAIRSAAVRDGVLAATIDLELNGSRYLVRRERDRSDLDVIDHDRAQPLTR